MFIISHYIYDYFYQRIGYYDYYSEYFYHHWFFDRAWPAGPPWLVRASVIITILSLSYLPSYIIIFDIIIIDIIIIILQNLIAGPPRRVRGHGGVVLGARLDAHGRGSIPFDIIIINNNNNNNKPLY